MKHLLACLALCASLSASAQDDNCTVLGIQDLTQMVIELKAEIDSLKGAGMTRDSVHDIAVGVAWRGELALANLSDANLSDANLSNANLSSANLIYANLTNADLSNANLSLAALEGANLSNVDLSTANLGGAMMTCLRGGCPSILPSGYICEPDTDCPIASRFRIVPE